MTKAARTNAGERRERITERALSVFLRYGYDRTRMNDIAEAAAIFRPALYLVFQNKEEVFAAVVKFARDSYFSRIREGLPRYETLEAKLHFACEVWAIEGYKVLAANPNAADLSRSSFESVRNMVSEFQEIIAELLRERVPKTRDGYKAGKYARVLVFARRLQDSEKSIVLARLHEERFQDCSPAQVYASLLDDGQYHCSVRTMYRLLDGEGENRERRDQLIHPPYRKPELLATGPNQLWSWDITKLRGPVKWSVYYLCVILDVFSRYVTGWMIAYRETAGLAKQLIENSCEKQGIAPGQLTLHADRGSSMTSKSLALLLADLGVVKTHSRPYVSDDNPFSEAHFKTMKYRPEYPDRFGSIQDARRFCQVFFPWYNHQHHHSGLRLLTQATVHYGQAAQLISKP